MHDEKWKEIVGRITDTFAVSEHQTEPLDPGPGSVEQIVFKGPLGTVKLERITKPRFLGTRGIGSKRIGGSTHVEYQYSDTEQVHTVVASRWDESQQSWVPLDGDRLKL